MLLFIFSRLITERNAKGELVKGTLKGRAYLTQLTSPSDASSLQGYFYL